MTDLHAEMADADDPTSSSTAAAAGGGGGRNRKAALMSVAGLLLGGGAIAFVGRTLVREWPRVSDEIRDAQVGWLVLAVLLAVAAMTSIGWAWRHVLRVLGVDAPVGRVVAWYYVGELGKYLPGGVWPVLGRGELARRGGIPRTRAYASVALSLGVLYLAAMFVAAAFLPFALAGSGSGFNPYMLGLLALPAGVAVLHHDVLARVVALVARLTKREIEVEVPQWRDSLLLVARYVPTWLFIGGATYAVARSFTADVSFPRVMFSSVLSWVMGFLAIPVPSGAGIREAVLKETSDLSDVIAVTTAVAARIIFVLVDVLGAVVCAPIVRRMRGGASVGPRPHPDEPAADAVAPAGPAGPA